MSVFEWTPVEVTVAPTILVRFVGALVDFANAEGIELGRLYPCPLVQVEQPNAGQPYRWGTVQRQTNDVLKGKLGAPYRKAHPELANVRQKRIGEQVFWYRVK